MAGCGTILMGMRAVLAAPFSLRRVLSLMVSV
jgi:hypothetical protein